MFPRISGRFLAAAVALASVSSTAQAFAPNDPYYFYDPRYSYMYGQWHLWNRAPISRMNSGVDSNILKAWGAGITGEGVVIGIIDDGVAGDHPDLAPNYRADLSKNFSPDPTIAAAPQGPQTDFDNHGTAVAGVAAARGGNGIGVTGAAPLAQIAGQRISFGSDGYPSTTANIVEAFLWKSGATANGNSPRYVGESEIDVSNNSWGPNGAFQPKRPEMVAALEAASLNNTIFLFAAGNSRGDVNQQVNASERNGAETVITVAAVNALGVNSSYSSWGSSVFVSGLSNEINGTTNFGITTTDRQDELGYNTVVGSGDRDSHIDLNYTSTFGGTSSATPLVAGIIALGKQVAPEMDVRFAKHVLARNSRVIDENNDDPVSGGKWVTNGAGLRYNPNYGFGLADASAYVSGVESVAWVTDRTVATSTQQVGTLINGAGVVRDFTFANSALMQKIEGVELTVSIDGADFFRDLQLSILSPSGTTSDVYRFDDSVVSDEDVAVLNSFTNGNLTWTFTSNAFWGEDSAGTWQVSATGRGEDKVWRTATLTLNMGDIVLEGSHLLTANVKAHSVNLDRGTSSIVIASGSTFTVTDSVNIYGGLVRVEGLLTEGTPSAATSWNKLSKITVTTGGTLEIASGGNAIASRGLEAIGGRIVVASGGALTTNGAAVNLSYGSNLIGEGSLAIDGALNVGTGARVNVTNDATFSSLTLADIGSYVEVGGRLGATGGITMSGGELRVGTAIDTAQFDMSGGVFALGGTGTVGAIRISGGFTVSDSAIVLLDVLSSGNGAGAHDVLTTGGATSLQGGTLLVNVLSGGVIRNGESVRLISGNISGNFAEVVVSGAKPLMSFVQNTTHAGTFDARVDFAAGVSRIGGSSNMRGAAGMLDAVVTGGGPNSADLITAAENAESQAEGAAVLNAFVPNNGLAVANTARGVATSVAGSYNAHVSRLRSGDINISSFWTNPLFESYSFDMHASPVLLASNDDFFPRFGYDESSFSVWANGNATFRKTKNDASRNLVKSKDNSYGATIGADYRITKRYEGDLRAGFFVSMQSGDSHIGEGGSKSKTESTTYAPGAYITAIAEGFEFDLMASHMLADYKLRRDVPALGSLPAGSASADPSGSQTMLRFGSNRRWLTRQGLVFGPEFSLAYVHGQVDGYTESGAGIASMTVDDQKFDSLVSSLGFSMSKPFNWSSVTLFPTLSLAWEHEFLDRTTNVGVSGGGFGPGFGYTAQTPELGADTIVLGANTTLLTTLSSRFTVGYEGRFLRKGVTADHRISATFRYDF